MKNQKFKIFIVFVLLFSVFRFPFSVQGQVRPIYDYGASGLLQALKKLNTTKSVMMIGAHPDDEDSALLAYLARGENARTAYLSLTRGDGGQNIIGPELFESLGVIRTEELQQARRLDGAEQYFTRAFDYGFSKTLAEARQKWDEKIILCDSVRAIRTFRPLVVISRFAGTPNDGHGQHQYAGYISPLAVKAAADEMQCKDSGTPWQVQKFYVEQGFRANDEPTLTINTGEYNFLLGRSYAEIAAEGRSQHKTQEQGGIETKGDRFSGLNLMESKVSKIGKEQNIFDGIDTSISSISKLPNLPKNISNDGVLEMQKLSEQSVREFEPENPQKIIPLLIKFQQILVQQLNVYGCLDGSATNSGFGNCDKFSPEQRGAFRIAQAYLAQKNDEIYNALKKASGIRIDALANREIVVKNEPLTIAVRVFIPKNANVKVQQIYLENPNNWSVAEKETPKENASNFRSEKADAAANFDVTVNKSGDYDINTQPYYLEKERNGALYNWENTYNNQNLPFAPPLVKANINIEIGGTVVRFSEPVEFRYADEIRGEIRRELNIVPLVSVDFEQDLLLVSDNEKSRRKTLTLNVTNNSANSVSGTATLDVPKDWKISTPAPNFVLNKNGEKTSVKFVVNIPQNARNENYEIGAKVEIGGEIFTKKMNTVAYPHIQTHRFYTDAKAKIVALDLKTASVKAGYITGSGDEVPEAVRQMGLPVDLLSEKDLSNGDLSIYDVIIVGIRAYQVRADLTANNQKVLDYVKNGGTLIVQYQRPDYVAGNFQPFPANMTDKQGTTAGTTSRVVDENAKVTILQPDSPIFNFPNKITEKDFDGWVQERDLYNFVTFDEKYTGLLESHDAGEQKNKGGMVYAKVGKGSYIYTSYSFFRQLPAGVPGAYRLFANLLSLPKAQK